MNLKEFLKYKTKCPLCGDKLSTLLSMRTQQEHIMDGDKYIIKIPQRNMKHRITYQIGHIFGLKDNSYHVEFYDDKGWTLNSVTLNKYNLFKNKYYISPKYLYRECKKEHYDYHTEFTLPLKTCKLENLLIEMERFSLSQKHDEDTYFHAVVRNYPSQNRSHILYGNTLGADILPSKLEDALQINNALFPILTEKKMLKKLKTLITFS